MSENRTESPSSAAAQQKEAAAIRRRWITLGETVAVIALIISALTLWNNWSQRSDSEAAKSADARRQSARAATLVLVADGAGSDTLTLKPTSPDQSVQSQRIVFPSALGVTAAQTTGEPRIEAGWFERALKKARDVAKLPDNSRGDETLPIAVTTRFLVDGEPHEDTAIYDLGYSISGRFLGGHSVTLRGVSLVSHVSEAKAQGRIDRRWGKLLPQEASEKK